MPLSTSAV